MVGIYGILRKSDNKCVYVGESRDINGRIKYHLTRKRTPFNKDEYYGKTLETHDIDDKTYRLNREAFFINKLNPELNVVRDRHFHHSEETKKKQSKANLGEKNPNFGKPAWNRGISPSEETKEKMKGRHPTEETKQKLTQAQLGRKMINNGVINTYVKPDELHQYLNNGWVLGRIKPLQ